MMPMVSRKSSTGMPLSTWMFLKTVSAAGGFGLLCGQGDAHHQRERYCYGTDKLHGVGSFGRKSKPYRIN